MALRDSSVAACGDEKKSTSRDAGANLPYEGLICRLFCDVRNGNEVGPLMPVVGVGGLVE